MGSDLRKEAPNVVTEALFKSLMRNACQAEVVCKSPAQNRGAVWYGEWIIRAVNRERTFEKLLVPARKQSGNADEVTARTFKTANGLISFLRGIGCTHVNIPLHQGGRSTHVLLDSPSTSDSN